MLGKFMYSGKIELEMSKTHTHSSLMSSLMENFEFFYWGLIIEINYNAIFNKEKKISVNHLWSIK